MQSVTREQAHSQWGIAPPNTKNCKNNFQVNETFDV